ncbi:MAG: hypothetical protein WC499_03465 [Patescibacteria group bacterium]
MVEYNRQFERHISPEHGADLGLFNDIYNEIKNLKEQGSQQDSEKKYNDLREKFIKENPESALMIEALFGIRDMTKDEERLAKLPKDRRWTPEQQKIFRKSMRELTEWQFAITHFILKAGKNEKLAESFWSECDKLNSLFSDRPFQLYQKGIIGQVGVYKMMEHFGLNPEMAHPDKDAFESTDLLVPSRGDNQKDNPNRVQTKYRSGTKKTILIPTKEISYPSIDYYEKERNINISYKDKKEMFRFKEKCDAKAQREHKEVVGFYLACPDHSFNFVTGEPSKEFLAQIEPEIKKCFPEK